LNHSGKRDGILPEREEAAAEGKLLMQALDLFLVPS
jgi:hypothetical protein